MNDNEQLQHWIDRVDTELVRYFADKDMTCNPLDRAMEYTLLAGGKRLRPLLTMVVVAEYGGDPEAAIPFALASEFLHTYSLIHDDLPCMDDDDMRRGKPTNHIIFGEANAILAGDALHSESFLLLSGAPHPSLSAEKRNQVMVEFCQAVGKRGMVAGQIMDLAQTGKDTSLEHLELLHQRKTGALLRFCVRLGAHLAEVSESDLNALTQFAEKLGLLFQVVDDLLDEESDSATLGKTSGKDAGQDKATFPKIMGSDEAHDYADKLLDEALAALKAVSRPLEYLEEIVRYVRHRDH
ncbi:polyprenyl synthetase family protein [Acanthopleuribacter pedis]|uniref:Polyprenyl synthetase family protein n=1 Tax=Acanthopleuribacter pedis TaxID=442870 RepID=A0A8J7U3Y6_9BACT|nr:farnesyl diphosphate synthase [Acanthopleuribacter pedis]MBO1320087.1 polyprenyl synthetase family protein [Acanthopleuribacter pedis]